MNELLEKILSGALTLLLFGWIWSRFQTRHDELEKRVLVIEQEGLTRPEFQAGLAAAVQGQREMHQENQACLKELRDLIAANEVKRHNTEHAILNVVNALSSKAAAAEAVQNYRDAHGSK
jgi:hypothetical protein